MSEQKYTLLTQIAPTVAQPGEFPDFFAPWQEVTRTAGRALGRSDRAEQLVGDVEAGFARAREQHPGFADATAAYAGVLGDGGYYVESTTGARATILTSLGFSIAPEIVDLAGAEAYAEVSAERVDLLDHDVLVWEIGDSTEARAAIDGSALYQLLAVATRRATSSSRTRSWLRRWRTSRC